MKTRSRITKLIAITMAVAAIAVVGSIGAAGQVINGHGLIVDVPTLGFVPGQTLRLSVADISTREEGTQPVRVQAAIYDSLGNLVRQTDPVELSAGRFIIFDFDRDSLSAAGEPRTGRLQVRAVIQLAFIGGSVRPVNLTVSTEVMDNRTGATTGGLTYQCQFCERALSTIHE